MNCPKCSRQMSRYGHYKKHVCHYCGGFEIHNHEKPIPSAGLDGYNADRSSVGWHEFKGLFSADALLHHLVNDGYVEKNHTFPSGSYQLTERGRKLFADPTAKESK